MSVSLYDLKSYWQAGCSLLHWRAFSYLRSDYIEHFDLSFGGGMPPKANRKRPSLKTVAGYLQLAPELVGKSVSLVLVFDFCDDLVDLASSRRSLVQLRKCPVHGGQFLNHAVERRRLAQIMRFIRV